MRIVDFRERTVPISRYADPDLPSGGLTTSIVAIVTDVVRDGRPVVGYGFSSFGRYGQGGLIRERFAPRLRAAEGMSQCDPLQAWSTMMAGEKPGGHGERCVAVGTLDMALWDVAAKIAGRPLYAFLAAVTGRPVPDPPRVPVYAGGGYPYPTEDTARLMQEVARLVDAGHTRVKMKIGTRPIAGDLARIEAAVSVLGSPGRLAVDAMNVYDRQACLVAAEAFAPYRLWWFEDLCDPLDFETQAAAAAVYAPPIAAGEALFSRTEARLLHRHAGLRPDRDILLFDPVHCYGLTHYLDIVDDLTGQGWPRRAFWPHGGHLFSAHVACGLGLGGSEVNPFSFQPFGGLPADVPVVDGQARLPDRPGIGFEGMPALMDLLRIAVEA